MWLLETGAQEGTIADNRYKHEKKIKDIPANVPECPKMVVRRSLAGSSCDDGHISFPAEVLQQRAVTYQKS